MRRYGRPEVIVTDKLRSYGAAMKVIGNARCCVSDRCEVCKSSPLSILQCKNTSIRNAIFTHDTILNLTEPPHSPSGANLARHKWQLFWPS
ncbi:hypothetical protein RUA4292_01990 [Ruegeria atlantica]|uniref:DDE domain-containing protein n=1 Tax=Ruegeria atlantica TaxID=81569 RepID=A0A0P1EEB7_9RHOB|nr:hypothetical protein RUA4292_01990 [Ruegeria atlantica]